MRKLSFLSSVLSVSALLFALGSCTEGNIDNGDNTGGDQTPGEPVVPVCGERQYGGYRVRSGRDRDSRKGLQPDGV